MVDYDERYEENLAEVHSTKIALIDLLKRSYSSGQSGICLIFNGSKTNKLPIDIINDIKSMVIHGDSPVKMNESEAPDVIDLRLDIKEVVRLLNEIIRAENKIQDTFMNGLGILDGDVGKLPFPLPSDIKVKRPLIEYDGD